MTSAFFPTSVARRLISRMQATHERRRISVFSGPPGIGKTTAIDAFRDRFDSDVVVVKVARRNAKEVLVLQHVLEAIRQVSASPRLAVPSSIWELRRYISRAVCDWADLDPDDLEAGERRVSVVFDEAQNLSREALEVLRFWNDGDRCYSPCPLGLIFVGNNEFALKSDAGGPSVISAAVADRALYLETFEYADVTDEDLALAFAAGGLTDPSVVAIALQAFRGPHTPRSFRRVMDYMADVRLVAGAGPLTADVIRQVIAA